MNSLLSCILQATGGSGASTQGKAALWERGTGVCVGGHRGTSKTGGAGTKEHRVMCSDYGAPDAQPAAQEKSGISKI